MGLPNPTVLHSKVYSTAHKKANKQYNNKINTRKDNLNNNNNNNNTQHQEINRIAGTRHYHMKQLKYVILATLGVGIYNAGTTASHLDRSHGLRASDYLAKRKKEDCK